MKTGRTSAIGAPDCNNVAALRGFCTNSAILVFSFYPEMACANSGAAAQLLRCAVFAQTARSYYFLFILKWLAQTAALQRNFCAALFLRKQLDLIFSFLS